MMRFRFFLGVLTAAAAILVFTLPGKAVKYDYMTPNPGSFITGQLLVAGDDMQDPRFIETVIFMLKHDRTGAMGLVVNRVVGKGPLSGLMQGFGLNPDGVEGTINLYYGGPVETSRGFLLHSPEYTATGTEKISSIAAVTSDKEVFLDIAAGKGPKQSIFAMGYSGWGPGQLEGELAKKGWVVAPASKALIFSDDPDSVWKKARASSGLAL